MDMRGMPPRRMVVGISGASGVIYGVRLLQLLRKLEIETHLVMSRSAQVTLAHESDYSVADIRAMASGCHSNTDMGASISSGSFPTMRMVVVQYSIKTLTECATSETNGILSRAADDTLKERRQLVLVVRETPLHLGHLRTMVPVTEAGAIVYPPVPAFYANP